MQKIEIIRKETPITPEEEYYRITHDNGITDDYQIHEFDSCIDGFRSMCEEVYQVYSSEPEYNNINSFYEREFHFNPIEMEDLLDKVHDVISDLKKAKGLRVYIPEKRNYERPPIDENIKIDPADIPF